MVINWLSFILLSFAVFRLARLFVFDTIMAPLRSLFHEEKTETAPDGTTETYIVIKGKGIRAFIGELLSRYWCTGMVRRLFNCGADCDAAGCAMADFTFSHSRRGRDH